MNRSLLLFTLVLTGCASEWYARQIVDCLTPDQVVYLVGDFGKDSPILEDVGAALGEATRKEAAGNLGILALGDNLYESGLVRCPPSECSETPEAQQLRRVAWLLKGVDGKVFLLPGNHDYDSDALNPDRPGDITQWYFLEKLGVDAPWRPVLGDSAGFEDPDALYQHLYYEKQGGSAEVLAEFFAPRPVVSSPDVLIVGIDSQLLIDLYQDDREDLVEGYLETLREVLKTDATWRAVAAHHPLETYGKHRVARPMRFLFGPGWPQFPERWHKFTAIPGIGTLATSFWWILHAEQNIHSGPYQKYRDALYPVLKEEGVDLFLAGHDHNTQLIELSVARRDKAASLLQIQTGEAAKEDPVTRGRGSLAYHTGGGFVRLAFNGQQVCVEMRDRQGKVRHRHVVQKK